MSAGEVLEAWYQLVNALASRVIPRPLTLYIAFQQRQQYFGGINSISTTPR